MRRRGLLLAVPWILSAGFTRAAESLRGKLRQPEGKPPVLETPDGRIIRLEGDEATRGVLNDKRLAGMDVELAGTLKAPDLLEIGPIHTRSLFAFQDGRKLMITYYCAVCAIRFYTPGICWCCQEYTALDLIESDKL